MATTIKISDELYQVAKQHAKAYHRSIPGQVEYWAKLGRTAMENPDLPIDFIHRIFEALAEAPEEAIAYASPEDYFADKPLKKPHSSV